MLPGQLAVRGAGGGAGLNPPGAGTSHAELGSPQSVPGSVGRGAQPGWDCATPAWSSEEPRQRKDRASLTLHRTEQVTASPRWGCFSALISGPKQLHQAQFIVSPSPRHSFTCSRHCHAAQPICCNRLSKMNPSTGENYPSNTNTAELKRQSTLTS